MNIRKQHRTKSQLPKAIPHVDPRPRQGLSRYEVISLVVSSLALLVSIAAATLQPILQARYFNEYSERGLLQRVSPTSSQTAEALYQQMCRKCHADENGDYTLTIDLLNVGRRPLTRIEFIFTSSQATMPNLSIAAPSRSFGTENQSIDTQSHVMSGALAPGERVTLSLKVNITSSVIVRTEHGDTLAIVEPSGPLPRMTDEEIRAVANFIATGKVTVTKVK